LLRPRAAGYRGALDRGGVLRFYVRRAFRIVPLYYVVLTALALASTLPAQRAGLVYEYLYLTNCR
jgi:peptidoglycan/LPS O-acetylase OafA/YrhL